MLELPIAMLGFLLFGAAGFALGHRSARSARKLRELRRALETATAEREGAREELQDYRKEVSEHFATTSARLHDLTVQYRAVYDHLAEGASKLCPESFEALDGGLGLDRLPEGRGGASAPEQEADPDVEADEADRPS